MNKLSLFQTTETRQLSAAVRRDPQQQEADDHHRATTQRWVSQHGDGIWPQSGSDWLQMGQIWEFVRSNISRIWLVEQMQTC